MNNNLQSIEIYKNTSTNDEKIPNCIRIDLQEDLYTVRKKLLSQLNNTDYEKLERQVNFTMYLYKYYNINIGLLGEHTVVIEVLRNRIDSNIYFYSETGRLKLKDLFILGKLNGEKQDISAKQFRKAEYKLKCFDNVDITIDIDNMDDIQFFISIKEQEVN